MVTAALLVWLRREFAASGEEPAPGQTVVLEGDDVEARVRERLYGGRLPVR